MKYLKFSLYILISISFIFIITNLSTSISSTSNMLIIFFKSLLPYLLIFLIFNQILIKTKIIYIFSFLLEKLLYPLFKINSKEITLIFLSLLNGFPSSMIYSSIMKENKDLNDNQIKRIAPIFFLPSYPFIFFVIKTKLLNPFFTILTISLYFPPIIYLMLTRKTSTSNITKLNNIFNEIKLTFNNFDYVSSLKEIFLSTLFAIVNILGMISFYSLITLVIPSIFVKGLFEFSFPTNVILTSNLSSLSKTLLLLIILTFSSFSSISQACIYFDKTSITFPLFIKKRITMLFLSLIIFNLSLFFYF